MQTQYAEIEDRLSQAIRHYDPIRCQGIVRVKAGEGRTEAPQVAPSKRAVGDLLQGFFKPQFSTYS